jgi:carboxypeptidase Q
MLILSLLFASSLTFAADDAVSIQLAKIGAEISEHGKAYSDLKELTDSGPRLCGSADEAKAILWAKSKLATYGADKTWLQPVTVPHWVRGNVERAMITGEGLKQALQITALGTSPGTGIGGVEAEVIEVNGLDEVNQLGSAVKDKIVFYNRPMDPNLHDTFKAYGEAVDQRSRGAATAGRFGAKAVLVRSMTTLTDDDHPHTGGVHFNSGDVKIPAAAVSTHGANELSKMLASHPHLRVKLELSSESLQKTQSHNVIGEIKGSEFPEEYVVVGGHIDSWDLATGAMDDGAGALQSMEILRTFHALGIKPKRTLRVVLFACEEFGGYGGNEYANQVKMKSEKHVLALESDNGGFAPEGFSVSAEAPAFRQIQSWTKYLEVFHVARLESGDSETDVEPLGALGVPTVGLRVDPKLYFNYHHSSLDRFDIINRKDLLDGAKGMAALVYLASEFGI